jgi:hypothetical protein
MKKVVWKDIEYHQPNARFPYQKISEPPLHSFASLSPIFGPETSHLVVTKFDILAFKLNLLKSSL